MINSIIVSLNVAVFVLIANYLWTLRKRVIGLEQRFDSLVSSVEQHTKDYSHLVHADLLFSKQLKEINDQLVSMDNQIQSLENKRDNDGGYQHAMKILEMGGNREEIVDSCHLSPAEAEFLMNLQAYRSAMKTL
jgi:septal ring factor EnvC (AmiA/AmiB activator)